MFFRNSVRRKSIFGALLKSISIPHFQRFVRRFSLFRSFLQIGFFLNELFWDFVCKVELGFFRVLSIYQITCAGGVGEGRVCCSNKPHLTTPPQVGKSLLVSYGLLNDIRYGSFIIVGLRGKLPKASDYFLFSREKIKELILLSYPVFLSARQDSYGRLF